MTRLAAHPEPAVEANFLIGKNAILFFSNMFNILQYKVLNIDIRLISDRYFIDIISISYRLRSYQDTQGQLWIVLCAFRKEGNGQNIIFEANLR